MSLDPTGGRRSISPASSGRSSPVPRRERRAVEDELYKADKGLRRYGALIERAVNSWETAPQEWADYIAFLARLLKAIQTHPKDVQALPHTEAVAYKLAQCLNPALPSGVHQKALEVYTYIFHVFGLEYVSGYLHDYLSGLAPVLTFASLSVRPGLYALFEQYLVKTDLADLRPATKALISSLLPALEDENSEDFDRALAILQCLGDRFNGEYDGDTQTGFFWQTLFLCVITSSSRRQGARNYLIRRLPRLASRPKGPAGGLTEQQNDHLSGLPEDAKAVISPEPGLLVRCFVAGLSDTNTLVQRGFLELLVTHLPLDSPVLQQAVGETDLDRLMSAALNVLLRRDMSLNRRLWSWLEGPEPNNAPSSSPSTSSTVERTASATASSSQLRYFEKLARAPLIRCLIAMLSHSDDKVASRSRPFRICLSLMDRWEIGGSVLPHIFLPAMKTLYAYSRVATPMAVAELLRSASLFFDGVEASLIWSTFVLIIRDAVLPEGIAPGSLDLLAWILDNFNVRDQEMVTVHAPLATLFLLSRLDNVSAEACSSDGQVVLQVANTLVGLISTRALVTSGSDAGLHARSIDTSDEAVNAVTRFYESMQQGTSKAALLFEGFTIGQRTVQQAGNLALYALQTSPGTLFPGYLHLFMATQAKISTRQDAAIGKLTDALERTLDNAQATRETLAFPMLSSTVTFISNTNGLGTARNGTILRLTLGLADQLWQHLSPSTPKYHVEASRLLWQLEGLAAPGETFEVTLLDFMRPIHERVHKDHNTDLAREETVRRFATLWNHTVPSQAGSGTTSLSRRGSGMPSISDAAEVARRVHILSEPLLRVVDLLQESSTLACEVASKWLRIVPSLDSVFGILFARFEPLIKDYHDRSRAYERQGRDSQERVREITYLLTHFSSLLGHGSEWTWECFSALELGDSDPVRQTGMVSLTHACLDLLTSQAASTRELHRDVVSLLHVLVNGPASSQIRNLDVDDILLGRMMTCLRDEEFGLQSPLLHLITAAIKLRVKDESTDPPIEATRRSSLTGRQLSTTAVRTDGAPNKVSVMVKPPPQLMQTLRIAFASQAARVYMEQWVAFLAAVLPTFESVVFSSLIPLVETLCAQLKRLLSELVGLTTANGPTRSFSPDAGILCLLEALEVTLARAHECLAMESVPEEATKTQPQTNGFLSGVTSAVFKVQGSPSKTSHANSRLTVILAFQDSIRCCLEIWTWSNKPTAVEGFDKSSAATTTHCALRLRNKTRYLLEQIFTVEPLESLEVIIDQWRLEQQAERAAAVFSLLQVMQGSRPKHVLPAILDSLYSRANPSALPPVRQSSQTIEATASDVALFLLDYLRSTEDDAMDEVWADSVAFLRDVLTNPLPFRHLMPALLALVHLLSQKLGNTNYGEQKKMRRELADMFHRLLAATYTTMSSGFIASIPQDDAPRHRHGGSSATSANNNMSALAVLQRAVDDIDTILDSPDRIANVITSISNNVFTPTIHSKAFPGNVSIEHLDLMLAMAKRAPASKAWKKDVTDALNDPMLFASSLDILQAHWLPVLHQLALRDRDRMPELLSRLTQPMTAGIMFGVGANAARLEADRKTQLNLRRVCLLLLASPVDTWAPYLREFDEKLVELFGATSSSSPSSAVKADLYMLCRALMLSFSGIHLSPLWPTVNSNLQIALRSFTIGRQDRNAFTNLSILQACKLLDQVVMLSPDEFQLHEWLYIADTVDAVYEPSGHFASALADQVAEALGSSESNDNQASIVPVTSNTDAGHQRRLLLRSESVDTEDIKAMDQGDFAKAVIRPFLSQLSIHAYEGVYSMEAPDAESCRRGLLEDVSDLSTVVD